MKSAGQVIANAEEHDILALYTQHGSGAFEGVVISKTLDTQYYQPTKNDEKELVETVTLELQSSNELAEEGHPDTITVSAIKRNNQWEAEELQTGIIVDENSIVRREGPITHAENKGKFR